MTTCSQKIWIKKNSNLLKNF